MSDKDKSSSASSPPLTSTGLSIAEALNQLDPKRGHQMLDQGVAPHHGSSSNSATPPSSGAKRGDHLPRIAAHADHEAGRVSLDVSFGPASHRDKGKAAITNADAPAICMTRYRPPGMGESSTAGRKRVLVDLDDKERLGAAPSEVEHHTSDNGAPVEEALAQPSSLSTAAPDVTAGTAEEAGASTPYGPANNYSHPRGWNKGPHTIEPHVSGNKYLVEDDDGEYYTESEDEDDPYNPDAEHTIKTPREKYVPAWKSGHDAGQTLGTDISHWGCNVAPFTAIEGPVRRMVRIKRRKYQGPPATVQIGSIQGMGRHCRYVPPREFWDAVDLASSPQFKHLVAVSSSDAEGAMARLGEVLLYPIKADGTVDKSEEPLRLPPDSELVEVPFDRHEIEWRGPLTGYEVSVCNADMSKPVSMRVPANILSDILDIYAEHLCAEALPCVPIMPADMDMGPLDNERLTSNEVHAYKTALVRRKRYDLGRLCRAWWNGASKEWEDVVIVGAKDGERAARNIRAWIPDRRTRSLRLTLQMPLVNMWLVLRSLARTRRDPEEPMRIAKLTLLHSFEPEKFPRDRKDFDLATWNTTLDQFDVESLVYEPYSGDRIIDVKSLDVVARALRRPWPLKIRTTWSMNLDPAVEMAAMNAPICGVTSDYAQESLQEAEENRVERKAEQDRVQNARRAKDDPEVIRALPKKERKALNSTSSRPLTPRETAKLWGTYYDVTRDGGRERIMHEAAESLSYRQEMARTGHAPDCRYVDRSGQLPMPNDYRKRVDSYVPRDLGPPTFDFSGRHMELGFDPPVPYGYVPYPPHSSSAVKAAALKAVPMLKPSKSEKALPFSLDGLDGEEKPSRENYDLSRDWEEKSEYRQWYEGWERWEEGERVWRRRLEMAMAQQPRPYTMEQYARDKRERAMVARYAREKADRQEAGEKEARETGEVQERAVKRARCDDGMREDRIAAPTPFEVKQGSGAKMGVGKEEVHGTDRVGAGRCASGPVALATPASTALPDEEDPEEAAMNGASASNASVGPASVEPPDEEDPEEVAMNGPLSTVRPAKIATVIALPIPEDDEEAAMNNAPRKPVPTGPSNKRRAGDERCAVTPQKGRAGRPPMPSASDNVVQLLTTKRKREESPPRPRAAASSGVVKSEPKRKREHSPPRLFALGGRAKSELKPDLVKETRSDDRKPRPVAAPIEVPKPLHPGHTYMDLAYASCDKSKKSKRRSFKKHAPKQVTTGVPVELPLAQPLSDRTKKRRKRAIEAEAAAAARKKAEEVEMQVVGHAFAIEQRPPRLPWASLDRFDEEERAKREIWADLFGLEDGEYKRFDDSTRMWLSLKNLRKEPKAWRLPQGWVPQNPLANQLLHHMLLIWVESLTELELRAPWMDLFRDEQIRRCSRKGKLVDFTYKFVPLNAKAARQQLTRTQQRKKHASPNPPVGALKSLDNILMWDFKHRPDKWYRTIMRKRAHANNEHWDEPEARRTLYWKVEVPYDLWLQEKDRRRFKGLGRDSPFQSDPADVNEAISRFLSVEVRSKFDPPEEAETHEWSDQRYFAAVKEFLLTKKRVRTQVGEVTLGLGMWGTRPHKFSGRNMAQVTGFEYMDEKWVARHVRAWKAEYEQRASLMLAREEREVNDPEWLLRRDRTVDEMIQGWVGGWDEYEREEVMRGLRKRYGAKKLFEACNWWLEHDKYPGVKVGVEWRRE